MRVKNQDANIAFGRFLREAREKQGLYAYQVAEQAGIGTSYYNYIENGKRNVSLELAITLSNILHCDLAQFIVNQAQ